MLTVEMKINGTLIGQIYAHNKGHVNADDCIYTYHIYQMDMKGNPIIAKGEVIHNRNLGFNKLLNVILEDIG